MLAASRKQAGNATYGNVVRRYTQVPRQNVSHIERRERKEQRQKVGSCVRDQCVMMMSDVGLRGVS